MSIQIQDTIVIDDNKNISNVSNITFNGTSHLLLPVGTTSERPLSLENGMFRYNTTIGDFEGFSGEWKKFAGNASLKGPLKILTATKTASQTTTTPNTYITITDLSSTIALDSITNKVRILASIQVSGATTTLHSYSLEVALYRDSTQICSKVYTKNLSTSVQIAVVHSSGNTLAFNYMDTPNTLANVTYSFRFKHIPHGARTLQTAGINFINSTLATPAVTSEMYLEEYTDV
jgi:hypothetical protein